MDSTTLLGMLRSLLPEATFDEVPAVDYPTIVVGREHIVETCSALKDTPALSFSFLSDVTAVDVHPREPRFEVVYHLVCLGPPDLPPNGSTAAAARVRLKVRLDGADARVPTVSSIFPNANWGEREVYDLFGIVFDGHPDLRRILMPEDWEGYPLRKDYPVQVKVPYRSHELLQVTEEEFVANIERQRVATASTKKPS
jgi:NADH-quinone oxidoreductase subunit C